MQKHSLVDVWRCSEYACVQTAPGSVLCHHSKHLMGYLEFLNSSRIICLFPLFHWNIALATFQQKARWGRDSSSSSLSIQCNIHTLWRKTSTIQTNGNHHRFFIRYLGHAVVHSVDKTHVLVVTVKLIGLSPWIYFLSILLTEQIS